MYLKAVLKWNGLCNIPLLVIFNFDTEIDIFITKANCFHISVISLLDYKWSVTASAKHISRSLLLSTMKVFSCRFLTAFFTHLFILPFLQNLSAQPLSNHLSHCGFFWPVKHQQWNKYSGPSRDSYIMETWKSSQN